MDEEFTTAVSVKTKEQVEVDQDEEIVKYLIVGGSLAGTFVTLIILCYALDRCRRYKKMSTVALPSAAVVSGGNDKFTDTAVQISNHQHSFSNLDSRPPPILARSTQSFNTKDSAINSNSNFEMSLLPSGSSSDHHKCHRTNYSLAASDSLYSSNSQSSLGHEEYSAEPKSWRRSRRGVDDVII